MNASSTIIHQALHGYSSGHRLLRCSIGLPPSSQREMLMLSDLSGPSAPPELQPYFTAYPLNEIRYYAVAKTWLAPELGRPGCVWTHTLLIDFKDLHQILDLRQLLDHFVSPRATDLDVYQRPVEHFTWAVPVSFERSNTSPFIPRLIEAVYSWPELPVLVAAETPSEVENDVFGIWSQQWPRLRQEFTFCTYSLASRSHGGVPFALQIAPTRLARELRRAIPEAVVVSDLDELRRPVAPWALTAADELQSDLLSRSRNLLWELADGAKGGRRIFPSLIKLAAFLADGSDSLLSPEIAMARLAEQFPEPTDAPELKQIVLGTQRPRSLANWSERHTLEAIAVTPHARSFDAKTLRLRRRASQLWDRDPIAAGEMLIRLLDHPVLNPHGQTIVEGLAAGMTEPMVEVVSADMPRLIPNLVRLNPALARFPSVWETTVSRQKETLEAYVQGSRGTIDPAVVKAILETGSGSLIRALGAFGGSVVPSLLSWIASLDWGGKLRLPDGWGRIINEQPEAAVSWLKHEKELPAFMLALIAHNLDANDPRVIKAGASPWIHHIGRFTPTDDPDSQMYLYCFGLALSLGNPEAGADELAMRCFLPVHAAAAKDRLTYECWRIIACSLPELPHSRSWDRCEQLRQGLLLAFIEYRWPVSHLLGLVSDSRVFSEILASLKEVDGGKRLLRALKQNARRIDVPIEVREMILNEK